MVEGHLGQLVLQIPWSNLKNKPVKVLIEDVFLLAVPKLDQDYDAEEEARRNQAVKLARLEDLELAEKISSDSNLSPEEVRKNQSFTDSLVTKIIDNLQITIKNIHIRYEDQSSVPNHPFSLGISLEELSAVSTNAEWDPIFIQTSSNVTHKLTTLSSLSVYWNTDSDSVKDMSQEDLIGFMSVVPTQKTHTIENYQYILRPVSGVGRITMNKGSSDGPKTKAQLMFDELGFVFDSDQYRDVLWVAELYQNYMRTKEFKAHRPKVAVEKDPKAWFKYAGTIVLKQVEQKNREWTWDYILSRREDKLRYIQLYKQKTTSPPLSPEDSEEINALELKYSFDDLRFYRSLARSELRKEKKHLKPQVSDQANKGWSSWFWGSTQAAQPEGAEGTAGEEPVTITEEQRQELYDAIEWDEKQAVTDAIDVPRDTVTMEVEATLKTGSFKLRRTPHNNPEDIVQLLFNGFSSTFFNRPDSFLVNMSLHELRIDDGSSTTLYKQIVSVKDVTPAILPISDVTAEATDSTKTDKDAFFWLSFESNPLDGIANSNLFIKMKSITVFYNTQFLENVMRFFKPPKIHLETISAILNAANATVEEIQNQTRLGLEYALQEHKTVNLKLDLQAPLIVMPLDVTSWSSPCAIIDAGHISVVSHLVGREVIEEVKKKKTLQYTDNDWKKLESLMYDKFNLQLHNTQLLIGSNVRSTMKQLHNGVASGPESVLDRLNLDFLIEVSILPEAQGLTKFKASGTLPLFAASMSDAKYKIMMEIIDKSIPNFSFDAYDEEQETSDTEPSPKLTVTTGRDAYSISDVLPGIEDKKPDDKPSSAPEIAPTKVSEQKVFEFNFQVEKVEMSLHRCTNLETLEQEPIVDMTLNLFELYYYFKNSEMMADVVLQSLAIEDYTQKEAASELTKIATSLGDQTSESPSQLFNVKYKRIKTGKVDKFGNEINDQTVAVHMSTMKYVVSPKSFLTILDFIITTFTNPNAEPPKVLESPVGETKPSQEDYVAKIDVSVDLHSIILLLNDDGIKLATLQLDSALVNVLLVPESMKVQATIGKLSLHDEVNEGSARSSILRQLISIEGSDLADFKYETFDPNSQDFHYNSSMYFRAGSIRLNVVEEPLARIMKFMSKFVQMKALYDSARLAAVMQANQLQLENANKIHFDILVSTPIVVIPKPVSFSEEGLCDIVVAHLGEIYAKNEYIHFAEDPEGPLANHLTAGLRDIKMSSNFNFPNKTNQYLEMIEKLDLVFDLSYVEPYEAITRPVTIIKGHLSDASMRFTELQYKFLMDTSSTFSGIFSGDAAMQEEEIDELERELRAQKNLDSNFFRSDPLPNNAAGVSKLDMTFHANKVALSLHNDTAEVQANVLEERGLTRFSLNESGLKLRIKNNGDLESDIHIKSFTVHDIRSVKENKYTEIIPVASHDEYQFMCNLSITGKTQRVLKALLTVDSPSMILAIDYLVALKSFLDFGMPSGQELTEISELSDDDEFAEADQSHVNQNFANEEGLALPVAPPTGDTNNAMRIEYHVNVVDASVILLANPMLEDSEAIVFKAEHFLLSKEEITMLSVSKVGMFLCRMNSFDTNRLRILDDFSLTTTMDDRGSSPHSEISKINISCEPLVLRLALRDVMLALDIVKRASALSAQSLPKEEEPVNTDAAFEPLTYSRFSKLRKNQQSNAGRTFNSIAQRSRTSASGKRNSTSVVGSIPIIRGQTLLAEFEGLRFVLIGTLHELPMLDMCAKPFTVRVRNWSSDLTIDTGIETFVNIYNYEKSAWEPLIEPWDLGLHVARSLEQKNTSINFYSRRMAEITVTSQTISIASKIVEHLSEDTEDFLSRFKDSIAPYRILNQTGYDLEVWIDHPEKDEIKNKSLVKDGEEIPWRFYNWNQVRENLSTDTQKVNLGVSLKGSPYDPVRNISVTSVGEHLHTLYPKTNRVSHRLTCEVAMDESVKCIIFRSALTFENKTQIPIDIAIGTVDNESRCWRIEPGKCRAIPIEHSYDKTVSVRPDPGFGFLWSRDPLYWKNMLNGPKSVTCLPQDPQSAMKFHFQATAIYDSSVPLTKIYPHMKVVLSAPIEITNLLPYDFNYRIFDKTTGKDWSNTLKQGATGAVHVVELSHLLLLSVHPKDRGFSATDFAVINSPKGGDFGLETGLVARSPDGQRLVLKLQYLDDKGEGSGCKVQVYAPYLILNKTGLDLKVQTKFNTATSKVQSVSQESNGKQSKLYTPPERP